MPPPLVSVIIPVYNAEAYLGDTLRSVFAQDYRPFEVLVIDDGSEDGSGAVARGFAEVRYFHQRNQGAAVARNLGIEQARGELIAFLEAHDRWMPGKLTVQVRFLLEHPDTDFVLSRQRILLAPGVEKPAWLKPELLANDSVGYLPSTLLARKSVFARIGGFDPRFVPAEDSEWFFRAKDAGVPMGVIPEVLLHKRVHDSNLSHHTEASQPRLLEIVRASIERQRKRSS